MYSRKKILFKINKKNQCEQDLVDSIIVNLKKGILKNSYQNAVDYFIYKKLLENNNCLDYEKSDDFLYKKIQNICNNCKTVKIKTGKKESDIINFGIITENNLNIISENNSFLIQE